MHCYTMNDFDEEWHKKPTYTLFCLAHLILRYQHYYRIEIDLLFYFIIRKAEQRKMRRA